MPNKKKKQYLLIPANGGRIKIANGIMDAALILNSNRNSVQNAYDKGFALHGYYVDQCIELPEDKEY